MIKQLMISVFNYLYYHAVIFFLTFPILCLYMRHTPVHNKNILTEWTLLAIVWLMSVPSWHKPFHWKSVIYSYELYKSLLERNNNQLLKSVNSPLAAGPIAENIGRHREGTVPDLIVDGSYDLERLNLKEENCSR